MPERGAVQPVRKTTETPDPANDHSFPLTAAAAASPKCAPANDNPTLHGLPACLPVADEEVRLLHRYLGAQILGLFA
jgi:hypothetical protein